MAIERVIVQLAGEGRVVSDLWHPDWSRRTDRRSAAFDTTPDAAMKIDGEQAALEVTTTWTGDRGTAGHRAGGFRKRLERDLQARGAGLTTIILGTYDIAALASRPKGIEDAELEQLVAAIVEISDRGPCGRVPVPDAGRPPWLVSAIVTCYGSDRPRVTTYLRPPRDPGAWAAEIVPHVRGKAGQVEPWGIGMVVLVHGFTETLQEVQGAFAGVRDLPLWRVYWMDPHRAHLVWSRADHAHDADATPPG